jgi:hypothetical protein
LIREEVSLQEQLIMATAKSEHPKSAGAHSNTEKDPADWTTGDEPMTGAQASYLKTLSEEANEEFDPSLNKADASRRIDELQNKTGRGKQT